MRIAVYETATGAILRTVLCPAASAGVQARAGEAVLEVGDEVTDATHRVVDGEVVPIIP